MTYPAPPVSPSNPPGEPGPSRSGPSESLGLAKSSGSRSRPLRSFGIALSILALMLVIGHRLHGPGVGPTHAQDPDPEMLHILDQMGGSMEAVDADKGQLLVGVGPRVVALDLDEPARPRPAGRSGILPSVVQGIELQFGIAYVALGEHGIAILDIADPSEIGVLGWVSDVGDARDVQLVGNHLYVASRADGLWIVDVAEVGAPSVVAQVEDLPWAARVHVAEGTAYVVNSEVREVRHPDDAGADIFRYGDGSVVLIDVEDPTAPVVISNIEQLVGSMSSAVVGQRLYLASAAPIPPVRGADDDALAVWDVSDPANPTEIARVDEDWSDCRLGAATFEGRLLLPCDGVVVYDISEPAQPERIAHHREMQASQVATLAVDEDGRAFAAAIHGGLSVHDATAEDGLEYIGEYAPLGTVRNVTVDGSSGVAAEIGSRLSTVDRGLGPLQLRGRTATSGRASDMVLHDGRLDVVHHRFDGPMHDVYEVLGSDPPRLMASSEGDLLMPSVAATFSRTYAVGHHATPSGDTFATLEVQLWTIDTSNPYTPTLRIPITLDYCGTSTAPALPAHVAVRDGLAYVSLSECALKIFALTHDAPPNLVGELEVDGLPLSSAPVLDGTDLFIETDGGLLIVDVENPGEPQQRSRLRWSQPSYDGARGARVVVLEDRAFVLHDGDVLLLDIGDRDDPQMFGMMRTPGKAVAIANAGADVVVADQRGGLSVLDPDGPVDLVEATPLPSATPGVRPTSTPAGPGPQRTIFLPILDRSVER